MSILDSILGTNTSAGTTQGAANAASALYGAQGQGNRALKDYTGQANQALTTNTQAGLGALNSGYGSAINALTTSGNQAQGQLASGVQDATGTVLGGNAAYQPFLSGGQGASTMLANSLGLNGTAGHDAATSAFQTSPGYQFQVDQSTGAAERAAAAAGGLGSGSTLDAITRLGSSLANTEYGNWQSNLQGLGTQGLNAANSISANNQTAGGYQMTGGTTGAQLAQTTGQNIGNAYVGQGTGQAGLYSNLGTGLSSNLTGLGQGLSNNAFMAANGVASADMTAGAAQDQAANANSGILSKLIGSVAGIGLGGSSLSSPSSNGFNIAPGSNGSFSISPTGGSTSGGSSGSGLFGPSINQAGQAIAKFL